MCTVSNLPLLLQCGHILSSTGMFFASHPPLKNKNLVSIFTLILTNVQLCNNSTSHFKLSQKKLDSQDSTLSVQTGLLAGISRVQFQVDLHLFQKGSGCHIDHSPPTTAKVNTEYSHTCAPPVCLHDMTLLWRGQKKWEAGRQVSWNSNSLEWHTRMPLSKQLRYHYR